jgi:hypothetical protein
MRRSSLRTAVSVAEILSALAVVLSLLYAVTELKRSRALTSTDIETILYDRLFEMDRIVAEGAGFADILVKASDDANSLSRVERTRYLAYEHIFYDSWEIAREASQNGLLDPEQFEAWDNWFAADAVRRPKLGWTGNIRFYNPEFIEYIESRVTWE